MIYRIVTTFVCDQYLLVLQVGDAQLCCLCSSQRRVQVKYRCKAGYPGQPVCSLSFDVKATSLASREIATLERGMYEMYMRSPEYIKAWFATASSDESDRRLYLTACQAIQGLRINLRSHQLNESLCMVIGRYPVSLFGIYVPQCSPYCSIPVFVPCKTPQIPLSPTQIIVRLERI